MNTTDNSIRVLLIEDNPGDVRLIREMLQEAKGRKIVLEHCATLTQGLQALSKNDFSILLLDLTLPDSIGFDTFVKVYTQNPQIPIVVLTGTNDEELARKSVRTGAQDYLIKGQIDSSLLSRSISYAIERAGLLRIVQQELIERKAMESRLRKINRALRVLSECNQIVVRATEEDVLAEKICGAITAVGEYQFAWIAFTESDDGKSIRPIAIAGSKDGNSSEEASAWFKRDPDSPLSEALTTGRNIVCNDVMVDKRCSNLRAEADKLGHRSFVILPLLASGRTLGILQICSREPDRFDLEELKLLDELKEDLAYAIVSIRTEKKRKRAEEALRDSEARYRMLFEASADGILIADIETKIFKYANPALCRMLGYTEEELRTLGLADIHPKQDLQRVIAEFESQASGDRTLALDIPCLRKDGRILYADINTANITIDGRPYNVGLFRDITERKQAEAALAEETARRRILFEQSPDGIVIIDPQTLRFIEFNIAAHRQLGYSREEFAKLSVTDVEAAETQEETRATIARVIRERRVDFETLQHTKDGEIRNVYVTAQYIDILGHPVFHCIWRDITDRKRAEEALRESETRYRSVLQSATDAIVIVDGGGIIIGWNSGAERIFGYSYTEAVGQSLTSIVSLYHHDEHTNGMKGLQSEGGQNVIGKTVEFKGLRKDKSVFPIELSLSTWETKSEQFFTGIIRDITERKRVEEALQESELRFRSLYENATIGIYRTTPDGNILLANPALVKMLGYTSFQKLAERNLEKDGFESSSQRKEFLEKIERDGDVIGYDSKWVRQDGAVIFVVESARAIRDSQGKTLYYDGTVEDITERRQMEEGLRQMQKLEGLGTLAGGIAHDFNNILGIILAYITSTKRFKDDAKKLDLAVNTIVKAVERGKTLVQQILTFARKTETEFGAVKVNDVVMEVMVMIFETFPKVLTYAQNFDKAIPYINADRSQLHQVLLNLCVNARDAMPKGGVLTINTRMVSIISLCHQHPDAVASSYVCIEVSDTGEGMTEEIRKRIFEPFFTTKGIGKGTGLGLAVVFGVVQTHKGFIDVESELGKGTTFRLYLPASQVAEPVSVEDEGTLEEIPGGTETLLVVEDEEMLMMSLQMVLVEKGYKVISAGDGLAAVNIYKERKKEIALVLTDLGLPKMNGKEECAQIIKLNPSARMIVATGYLDPGMKSEFLKAGIQHFLYKPYDLKKVLKLVRDVLDGK
jgi:PAS domain S-box-containing protein